MAQSRTGVPYPLWKRVDDLRKDKGWNKSDLARQAGEAAGLGKPMRTHTIENLRTSTRVPDPWIVNALADAVGLDRTVAHRLAQGRDDEAPTVPQSIRASRRLSERQKALLLDLYDQLVSANDADDVADDVPDSGRPGLRAVDDIG